ncbi:ABC transporter permease [Anaerolinea sp.]|uniref:ABC transporter permease n=1 Tax=Anaerolinea sp. TaxID=1872519 RepID=UPI002ACDAB55|nr:ABC transporter permease [Anaerolinea sp.]
MTAATLPAKKSQARQVSQSYWSLVWWKFKKNRIAVIGGIILILMYFCMAVIPEFIAPYDLNKTTRFTEARPQTIRFIDSQGNFSIRPFVYGLERKIDEQLRRRTYVENPQVKYYIYFFVKGDPYKLFGLIPWDRHLFGVDPSIKEAHIFLMGTDSNGRDFFSRIIYGGRLSLLIGLIGQFLTIILGSVLGAISGYYGGAIDMFVQRFTEFLNAFPDIPLFMALAAAIPKFWSPIAVYFMLTLILAFVRWGGLARQVRGLILSLREREYVLAAKSAGASDSRIMFRHLLPGTMSHVIVIATLSIPGMILSETALSWLGLGLRPPLTSWGVLLQEAGTVYAIRFAAWQLWTIPFILATIMAYNMLGDGLRDAMDPYSAR